MLQTLLENYGYPIVLLGAFLEGETVLVLGGLGAKLGYLDLEWVILLAFCGGFLGDQMYFFLGRYHGKSLLARHPKWERRTAWVARQLERHQTLLILSFHFLYGVRTVTPFVIGMSGVKTWRFVLLNAVGVAVWATVVGTAGYVFGRAVEAFLGDLKEFELHALALIACISLAGWLFYNYRRPRAGRAGPPT